MVIPNPVLYVPISQGEQVETSVIPEPVLYVPVPHGEHAETARPKPVL